MTSITAIETRYAGCRFRSRLEARWAVFFNALDIPWEYEPEGVAVPMGGCRVHADKDCWRNGDGCEEIIRPYLPDFWLPSLKTYVEVKGSDEQAPHAYLEMLANAIDFALTPLHQGLLLLGPVPDPTNATAIYHQQLSWQKGVQLDAVEFVNRWIFANNFARYLPCNGSTAPDYPSGITWEATVLRLEKLSNGRSGGWWPMTNRVASAYKAARSARFEHGENG